MRSPHSYGAPMRTPSRRGLSLLTVGALTSTIIVAMVASNAAAAGEPYRDPSLPVATRVADLLGRMSLDEKIGQMTQAERAIDHQRPRSPSSGIGSMLSGGGSVPVAQQRRPAGPTCIDGFQNGALRHAAGRSRSSTASTRCTATTTSSARRSSRTTSASARPATRRWSQQIGRATAEEVTGTGVRLELRARACAWPATTAGAAPTSRSARSPRSPSSMTTIVTGLQGSTLGGAGLGARHGQALRRRRRHDQRHRPGQHPDLRGRAARDPPAAVPGRDRSAASARSWSRSAAGTAQKLHGHQYLITDVLKGELGFTGFVVSDWDGIDQIDGAHRLHADRGAHRGQRRHRHGRWCRPLWQTFISLLRTEVQAGRVPMSRIDDANRRILTKKFELGLFERPLADRTLRGHGGQRRAPRRWPARRCAKSQVRAEERGQRPAAGQDRRASIFVAGKSADNIGNQSGGWTISWQGVVGQHHAGHDDPAGHPQHGRRRQHGDLQRDGSGIDSTLQRRDRGRRRDAVRRGRGRPARRDGPGHHRPATPSPRCATPGVPVVVVLVSGRPLDIAAQLRQLERAGRRLAARHRGRRASPTCCSAWYAPTGKLPVTWMQSASQQPINDGDGKTALFPYGFGLTYTPTGDTQPPTVPGTPDRVQPQLHVGDARPGAPRRTTRAP